MPVRSSMQPARACPRAGHDAAMIETVDG